MNLSLYMRFLKLKIDANKDDNTLDLNLFITLGSLECVAALQARAIFFLKVIAPLRFFANSSALGFSPVDMGRPLAALLDFLNSHFSDLAVLQEYLQSTLGGGFLTDHLEVGRIVLERVAKYLLLPGLEVDVNVQLKITALNSELLVRILTPEIELDEHGNEVAHGSAASIGAGLGPGQEQSSSSSSPTEPPPAAASSSRPYAVKFNAYVSMMDLIEDSRDIDRKLKESLQRAAFATLGGQAGAFD